MIKIKTNTFIILKKIGTKTYEKVVYEQSWHFFIYRFTCMCRHGGNGDGGVDTVLMAMSVAVGYSEDLTTL